MHGSSRKAKFHVNGALKKTSYTTYIINLLAARQTFVLPYFINISQAISAVFGYKHCDTRFFIHIIEIKKNTANACLKSSL